MKIAIEGIGPEGLEKELTLDRSWLSEVLDGAGSVDFRPAGSLSVMVRIDKTGSTIRLRSSFGLPLVADCAACAEDFELTVDIDFDIIMKPRPADMVPPPKDLELTPEDLDEFFYDGEFIDVADIMREQMILALPMYPRCSADCKGLCPHCGANLNHEECTCAKQHIDPRWEALQKLMGNN